MKTIGIIGGMSWESTANYYKGLNEGVRDRLGGLHSAKIIMASVDFAEIEEMQEAGRWEDAGRVLAAEARRLERAGADFIFMTTNTMHKIAPQIESAIKIPFLHIADAAAAKINEAGIHTVGLLATIYTMEQDFYRGRLSGHGLEVLVPETPDERREVNRVIFEELCRGVKQETSRQAFLRAARNMLDRGAEGLVLGCTEVNMLIGQKDFEAPVFDTMGIHIEKALDMALG